MVKRWGWGGGGGVSKFKSFSGATPGGEKTKSHVRHNFLISTTVQKMPRLHKFLERYDKTNYIPKIHEKICTTKYNHFIYVKPSLRSKNNSKDSHALRKNHFYSLRHVL